MTELVSLPLWVLILVLVLAAVTAMERIIGPWMRWFFRKRMERAVARLNKRLDRPIEPFKLLHRSDTVNRVLFSPEVMEAVQEHVKTEGVPEEVAFAQAKRYAREIVPFFSTATYFGFATRAAKLLSRSLYRVRLGTYNSDAISLVDKDSTVIFVMNHRSNMDYVLVTYLVAERSALAYAVGEWARIWPLRAFVQSMGGYFIRRRSQNPLYRRVLARYVQLSTRNGVTQAIFPEGRLSLDGKVAPAKLGLLSYILSGFDPQQDRDVVFVPVGINYERVLEDRVLTRAKTAGPGAFRLRMGTVIRYVLLHLRLRLLGRFHRFGYAAVSFGTPLSLKAFLHGAPEGDLPEVLGQELMTRIDDILPVLPALLMADILRHAEGPLSKQALSTRIEARIARFQETGHHVHLPREDLDYSIETGLRALVLRKIIRKSEAGFVVNPGETDLLDYYANMLPAGREGAGEGA